MPVRALPQRASRSLVISSRFKEFSRNLFLGWKSLVVKPEEGFSGATHHGVRRTNHPAPEQQTQKHKSPGSLDPRLLLFSVLVAGARFGHFFRFASRGYLDWSYRTAPVQT